jgi:maltose/moltooligosaccharide transporter
MNTQRRLTFWQLWNLSFGYVGIQFGFALQNANVSRIFETLGAKVENIPMLWIAAPIAGLVIQPLVGHMSDRTWNSWGRRKPYFSVGAVLSSLALLIMPNSPTLWIAAGMLWMLDASINVTMQPFRALIGDTVPGEQRTAGFAVQTFFIGASSVIASLCPYVLTKCLHIANTAPPGQIPPSVKWSFYVGGVAFLATVLWTVLTVREYSPEEQRAFNPSRGPDAVSKDSGGASSNTGGDYWRGAMLLGAGGCCTYLVWVQQWYAGLYILSVGLVLYGALRIAAARSARAGRQGGIIEIVRDFQNMPDTMKRLALVTMLTWFALFSMFIYSTAAVTSYHFGTTDPSSERYNTAANWVGVLMAVYNGVAALVTFLLPVLARAIGRVRTHVICLVIGGLGLMSMYVFRDPTMLLVSLTAVGIAWASLLTVPYAILSSAIPYSKMGVYMGLFNVFVVIPQILASATLGLLVRTVFHGQAIYAIVLGGAAMVLAAVVMAFVKDDSSGVQVA